MLAEKPNLLFSSPEHDDVFDSFLSLASPALHGLAYDTVLKCLRVLLQLESSFERMRPSQCKQIELTGAI